MEVTSMLLERDITKGVKNMKLQRNLCFGNKQTNREPKYTHKKDKNFNREALENGISFVQQMRMHKCPLFWASKYQYVP